MIYDDNSKKWVPSGTSSGLSKVHIFKHVINNTFRVVGRKLQDHEVILLYYILSMIKICNFQPSIFNLSHNVLVGLTNNY